MYPLKLHEWPSKIDIFPLMDLPIDLVHMVLERTVSCLGIRGAVRARLVNKLFASEILRAVCKPGTDWTGVLDGLSREPNPVTEPFVTGTLMACIQSGYGVDTNFLSAIIEAEELLMNEYPGQTEEQRLEYRYALCALENWRSVPRPEGFLTDLNQEHTSKKPTVMHSSALVDALCAVASMGNVALVQRLLDKRAHPYIHDGYFRPPLEQACKNGHYETVHLLLEKGAHINLGYERPRDGLVKAPLFLACLHGHKSIAELLFTPKYRMSTRLSILRSAIIPAIQGGHVELLQWLIQSHSRGGTSLKANGDTMLTEAVRHSRESVVRWLLENGVHPNNEKEWQRVWNHQPSILQVAALRGRVPIVRLLLQAGANRFVAALTFAAQNNHVDVAQTLLDSATTEQDCLSMVQGRHPFESKAAELTEQTPLLQAVKYGNLSMVRWLLERRVYVDFFVVEKVMGEDWEILRLLLRGQKRFHFNSASGWMLEKARERGDWRVVDLLMEARSPSRKDSLTGGAQEDGAMSG